MRISSKNGHAALPSSFLPFAGNQIKLVHVLIAPILAVWSAYHLIAAAVSAPTRLKLARPIPGRAFRVLRGWSDFQRANSDPKLLALNRFASAKASSSEYRNVPGFLSTQRSPDERDAKKKMKWQNFAITFAADVPKTCASGRMKEIRVPFGPTDTIRSGVTTRRTISPLSGSTDDTRAGRPRISGRNRLSQTHHVESARPSTSKRWCMAVAARPAKPRTRPWCRRGI
jgi:hypothetical protein